MRIEFAVVIEEDDGLYTIEVADCEGTKIYGQGSSLDHAWLNGWSFIVAAAARRKKDAPALGGVRP